jgi:hypothetical protein
MSSFLFDKNYQLISWKGKTFNQITSVYQMNQNTGSSNLFNAPPIKLYRKEIASVEPATCSKQFISIDEINQPGGSIIQPDGGENYYGLVNKLDFTLVKDASQRPGICTVNEVCQENNARRRVRSAGMIRKKDSNSINKNYYTNSYQYLQSRTKTFSQNQYNYIQLASPGATPSAKPGDAYSLYNVYYPNSVFIALDNSCAYVPPVYYKPNNNQFATQGAVSSSDRTVRKVYNTITSNTDIYNTAYGSSVENALAYGVPGPGYTVKDVIGYPNTKTPKVMRDGTLRSCNTFIYRM